MDDKMTMVRFDTHFVPVLFLLLEHKNFIQNIKQRQQIQMEWKTFDTIL